MHEPLVSPPLTRSQGNYLVFWWHEIALGQLFIEPNQEFTEEAYYSAVYAAIQPALRQYEQPHSLSSLSYSLWLHLINTDTWNAWMATALTVVLPISLPAEVPISVVICTRNRAAVLARCLKSLYAMPCRPKEIVVVDNAPTDNCTREIVQEFSGVVYIREPRIGLDIARNAGIVAAHCPVVAFIDDDVVVHPNLIFRIWETFHEPTTSAMTGLVIAAALQTEAQLIFEQHWSFNRGYVDKFYDESFLRPTAESAPRVWDIGAGANMAFRKSIFEEVGYFNELLDAGAAGCSGDSEMWYRILLHGHTIRYNPRAIVYHEHRKGMKELKRQLFYYMRGHAAAALIQHDQSPKVGYAKHTYFHLPKYYAHQIKIGFPYFRFRSRTLWAEVKGVAAGIAFYYRHRTPQRCLS